MSRPRRIPPLISRRTLLACSALTLGCKRDEPAPKVGQSVELWFGGDVHLGESEPRVEGLDELLGGGMGIVNLEGPVGYAPYAQIEGKTVRLANAASAVAQLKSLGVRVVGIANNHAMDRGEGGVVTTRAAIAKAKLAATGLGAKTAKLQVANRRVTVLAHDVAEPLGDALGDALSHAKGDADVLVVSLHVTGPPSYLPRESLRSAVESSLAAGARIVVAHGTHALGPIERRGQAVIAWGLGNLLFNCTCSPSLEGLILRVSLGETLTEARVIPIDAGLMGAPARPTRDAKLIFDVLEGIQSSKLTRHGAWAEV